MLDNIVCKKYIYYGQNKVHWINMKDKILRSMHGDYCTVCKSRKSKHDVELE